MRIPRCVFVLPFLAAALAAPPARAQQDTVPIEAIFRVDLQYGPSRVVSAFVIDTRLLLPLTRLLVDGAIGVADSSQGHFIAAVLEPAGIAIRFDTDSLRLSVDDSIVPFGKWDAVWRDGELYVDTDLLTEAFGVLVGIDWIGLTVVVARTDGLPIARRARRELARVRALRRQPAYTAAHSVPVPEGVADGAVLQWALTGATNDPLGNGSIQFGLGAKLLDGSIEFSYDNRRYTGGSFSRTRGSWIRAWPEGEYVKQLRLGDVQSAGRRSRLIRGVVATNQPFIRSSEFDLEEIIDGVPPGWEVELYDAYGLLDFGEADQLGGFRLALPLRYGANPFDMVLYGPRGEVQRRRRTIRIPFDRLPDHTWEYALGVGACHTDPCGAAFTADLRYGLSRRVTAQSGWDLMSRPGESALFQPYAAVSAAVLPSVSVTGEAVVNGLVRAQTDFEPTPDFRVGFSHTFFSAEGAQFFGSALDRRRTEGSLTWFRRDNLSTAVQISASRSSGPGSGRTFLRAIVTERIADIRFAADVRHSRVRLDPTPTTSITIVDLSAQRLIDQGPSWLRAATIGAGVGLDFSKGFESLRLQGGRAVREGIRVDLGLGWFRTQGGLVMDLGLSTTLGGPRFGSRNRFTSTAGTQGIQLIDGSLLWDRRSGHVALGDGRDLGRAGITGTVFLDLNGDGRRSEDEPGLEGVTVRVGGRLRTSDHEGRFSVWELFPFQPARVEVSADKLENPFYAVRYRVIEVIPTPNSFVPVEIPVVVGAEVSGGVLLDGEPLGGVRVVLHEIGNGFEMALITYADGGFYALGVPPGEYEASIPSDILAGLGATSTPVRFTVPEGAGQKIIEAVVLFIDR
ncbi:MAG TPA: carboxypeptidase-like regulatory domain-containing protein [Gemmatimonadales bacterium]